MVLDLSKVISLDPFQIWGPDVNRRTGRTTRMLKEADRAIRCDRNIPVFVIATTQLDIRYMIQEAKKWGLLHGEMKFLTISNSILDSDFHVRGVEECRVFIDHFALKTWIQRHLPILECVEGL